MEDEKCELCGMVIIKGPRCIECFMKGETKETIQKRKELVEAGKLFAEKMRQSWVDRDAITLGIDAAGTIGTSDFYRTIYDETASVAQLSPTRWTVTSTTAGSTTGSNTATGDFSCSSLI